MFLGFDIRYKNYRPALAGDAELIVRSPMGKEKHTPSTVIYICTGEKCRSRGSKEISKTLRHYVEDHDLDDVGVIRTHCTDNCKHGPVVCIQPSGEWHFHVDEHLAISLVKKLTKAEK